MPEASASYEALGDIAHRHCCGLGLTIIAHRRRRELGDLIVFDLGKRDILDREQIVSGEYNSAAIRLLSRLKRKGWE